MRRFSDRFLVAINRKKEICSEYFIVFVILYNLYNLLSHIYCIIRDLCFGFAHSLWLQPTELSCAANSFQDCCFALWNLRVCWGSMGLKILGKANHSAAYPFTLPAQPVASRWVVVSFGALLNPGRHWILELWSNVSDFSVWRHRVLHVSETHEMLWWNRLHLSLFL